MRAGIAGEAFPNEKSGNNVFLPIYSPLGGAGTGHSVGRGALGLATCGRSDIAWARPWDEQSRFKEAKNYILASTFGPRKHPSEPRIGGARKAGAVLWASL